MWDELADDVKAELTAEPYSNRTHGRRATYANGCRGPLCRKSERDEGQNRYARKKAKLGKKPARIVPGLWDEEARARDEELERVQLWHDGVRELARLNRLVQQDVEVAS